MEAEGLLDGEGEFLVRESTKMPGQFVLTGLSPDGPQHLLLMDKSGKVCASQALAVIVQS